MPIAGEILNFHPGDFYIQDKIGKNPNAEALTLLSWLSKFGTWIPKGVILFD